jgi:hypothetical protein
MRKKITECKICGSKEIVERGFCKEHLFEYNQAKLKKSYDDRKAAGALTRYGVAKCVVCHENMIKSRVSQNVHLACFNAMVFSEKENDFSDQSYLNIVKNILGFRIPRKFSVHHINCNHSDHDIKNMALLSVKDHLAFHGLLKQERVNFLLTGVDNNTYNWSEFAVKFFHQWKI